MKKIGIKFEKLLDYESFEPLQYWLDYDFEYEADLTISKKNSLQEMLQF